MTGGPSTGRSRAVLVHSGGIRGRRVRRAPYRRRHVLRNARPPHGRPPSRGEAEGAPPRLRTGGAHRRRDPRRAHRGRRPRRQRDRRRAAPPRALRRHRRRRPGRGGRSDAAPRSR
ncbi:hypothetical protein C5C50_12150 [Rathayibacter sp. AY1D9]|nr:hypothetical protein C5C50_12150 [Rathayibacter sp. AY1D9]